jgi:HEAT repeat protein
MSEPRRQLRRLIIVVGCVFSFLLSGNLGCQVNDRSEEESPVSTLIRKLLPPSPQQRRQKLLENLSSPDADLRREGVQMLSEGEAAGWEITPKILSIMAQGDPDQQVRAAALGALISGDDEIYLPAALEAAVKDVSPGVRRQCVTALAERDDQSGLDTLIEFLKNDSDKNIRTAAAQALANYRHRKAVSALLEALNDQEFSVSYRARESLQKLTGEDFGYDRQLWGVWLSRQSGDGWQN